MGWGPPSTPASPPFATRTTCMSVATATHRLAARSAASINVADEVELTTNHDAAAGRYTVTFLAEGAALDKKQLRRCTSEIKRAPGRFAS